MSYRIFSDDEICALLMGVTRDNDVMSEEFLTQKELPSYCRFESALSDYRLPPDVVGELLRDDHSAAKKAFCKQAEVADDKARIAKQFESALDEYAKSGSSIDNQLPQSVVDEILRADYSSPETIAANRAHEKAHTRYVIGEMRDGYAKANSGALAYNPEDDVHPYKFIMGNFELENAIGKAYERRDSDLGTAHYAALLAEQLRRARERV